MDDGRVKAFRMLKPPCVELSQVALRYKVNKTTTKELLRNVERLSKTLHTVGRFLDAKLADYVFFPLSHVFSESKDLPPRVLEHALSCLSLLIRQGWRDQLSSEVGKQLLILLAFLAGRSATDPKSKHLDEDVAAVAFECTTSLFQSSVTSSLGTQGAVSPENIPLLAHAVTVILDGISNGPSTTARLAASHSLDALITAIDDEEALRNFFPGIVSCLTKLLSSGMRSKTPYKVLQTCIQLLDQVLCKVLGDEASLSTALALKNSAAVDKPSKTWAEATASQVKVALSSIMPLRYHDRHEVQDALFSLCLSILSNCRVSLGDCTSMVMEALVALSSHPASEVSVPRAQRLQQILAAHSDLLDVLMDSLYDWTVALPRVVISSDEAKQGRTLAQLSTAFRLLFAQNNDLQALHDLFASNIQHSVASAIQMSSTRTISSVSDGSLEMGRMLHSATSSEGRHVFAPVIFDSTSQSNIMTGLQLLVRRFEGASMSTALQRNLMESLKSTTGNEQIASLWLILQLIVDRSSQVLETEQWLNLGSDPLDPLSEEAYSFSLEVLNKSAYDDAVDWRLQALSLEVVALEAKSQRQEFRPELVDALYPILERMGSSNAALQQHAVTCLSIVSDKCGYPSASDLIVNNADYLVNAIAVKLNTFDISPQASQVMLIMIRLCGSAITPYLDDLIESVFAILACYHGYPRLVESLFEVLNAIVEEGAKSSSRAIESTTKNTPNPREPYRPSTITDLVTRLQTMKSKADVMNIPPTPSLGPEPPTSPAVRRDPAPPSTAEEGPPPSKTHTLIHTITQQTTHHLSNPSPPLRRLLLTLIASSLPTLAPCTTTSDSDTTFLPLVVTLWPYITRQTFPSSTATTSITDFPTLLTALQTLTTTCQFGGSFLLSRISDLFPSLQTLFTQLECNMLLEEKTLGRRRASRSLKYKCWDAMVGLVITMVEYVGITRDMEDDVFEMLGGEALGRRREGVREALEGVNPDAIWLLEEGRVKGQEGEERWKKPVVEGWDFRDVEFC
ncbi:MAG: hypothetical protein Q9166_005692 [cf. Caloplaca sp. 2 TL-2023]